MGDDPSLYRTFVPAGRLDRLVDSRPVDQSDHVTLIGTSSTRSDPLRDQ
jgi:hypothetical protein